MKTTQYDSVLVVNRNKYSEQFGRSKLRTRLEMATKHNKSVYAPQGLDTENIFEDDIPEYYHQDDINKKTFQFPKKFVDNHNNARPGYDQANDSFVTLKSIPIHALSNHNQTKSLKGKNGFEDLHHLHHRQQRTLHHIDSAARGQLHQGNERNIPGQMMNRADDQNSLDYNVDASGDPSECYSQSDEFSGSFVAQNFNGYRISSIHRKTITGPNNDFFVTHNIDEDKYLQQVASGCRPNQQANKQSETAYIRHKKKLEEDKKALKMKLNQSISTSRNSSRKDLRALFLEESKEDCSLLKSRPAISCSSLETRPSTAPSSIQGNQYGFSSYIQVPRRFLDPSMQQSISKPFSSSNRNPFDILKTDTSATKTTQNPDKKEADILVIDFAEDNKAGVVPIWTDEGHLRDLAVLSGLESTIHPIAQSARISLQRKDLLKDDLISNIIDKDDMAEKNETVVVMDCVDAEAETVDRLNRSGSSYDNINDIDRNQGGHKELKECPKFIEISSPMISQRPDFLSNSMSNPLEHRLSCRKDFLESQNLLTFTPITFPFTREIVLPAEKIHDAETVEEFHQKFELVSYQDRPSTDVIVDANHVTESFMDSFANEKTSTHLSKCLFQKEFQETDRFPEEDHKHSRSAKSEIGRNESSTSMISPIIKKHGDIYMNSSSCNNSTICNIHNHNNHYNSHSQSIDMDWSPCLEDSILEKKSVLSFNSQAFLQIRNAHKASCTGETSLNSSNFHSRYPQEMQSLQTFFASLQGYSWANNRGWDGIVPPKSSGPKARTGIDRFLKKGDDRPVIHRALNTIEIHALDKCKGLEIDRQRRVVEINLVRNKLTGVFPDCIRDFRSLEVLNLENNKIQGEIPGYSFYRLFNLEVVSLAYNKLSGEFPWSIFSELPLLTELYLNHNNFRGELREQYFQPVKIPKLTASFGLKSFRKSNRSHIPQLSSSSPASSGEAPFASTTLSTTCLSSPGEKPRPKQASHHHFCWPRLRCLVADHNQFSGLLPDSLKYCKQLEVLSLGHNMFHGGLPQGFRSFELLTHLDLNHNRLTGEYPDYLFIFPYLEFVSLIGNQFDNVPEHESMGYSRSHNHSKKNRNNTTNKNRNIHQLDSIDNDDSDSSEEGYGDGDGDGDDDDQIDKNDNAMDDENNSDNMSVFSSG